MILIDTSQGISYAELELTEAKSRHASKTANSSLLKIYDLLNKLTKSKRQNGAVCIKVNLKLNCTAFISWRRTDAATNRSCLQT